MLKVLRMCIIAGAVYCFIVGRAENVLIAITIQETFIVLFFVIIYMVSLQHLLVCVHWPLLDLINSCMSAVFLGLIGIRTIEEKGRKKLVYIGGVLCLFASILCVFDALMVVKTMRSNRKKAPRIVPATAPSRPNLR
ncbi:CKLF-like MARVEL transmembrane domain-containing protein 1 [Meriones unguiculatus]|uniref:CKLF-like MARVEL transmembrane domain-containing protein 1 n=1 Tax=Meriones unguiculatus TaxID=10047 RepID=UPI00293E22C5|nr:CKLF-like MARVEL transmembrane domain-containing protein 1 [Meriones unguiculatus]